MAGSRRTESRRHFGHGRWERKQVYAIIGAYRHEGRSEEWVAEKLGVGSAFVAQVYGYFDWKEESEYLAAVERAGGDPLDDLIA